MPYGISESQADCANWATVKQETDGSYTTIGCHVSKQDAIDQMVAVSLAEEMEPLGQVDRSIQSMVVEKRNEELIAFIDAAMVILAQAKQSYLADEAEDELEEEPEEEPMESEARAVNLAAPAFMRASAKRGLALHEQGLSGDGLMPQTVEDARKMAAGDVSEAKWRKIAPWIARHIGDLDAVQGDEITAGLVAMLLWGGGSSKASARRAQEYAQRIIDRLDEEEKRAPAPKKDQIFGSDKNPEGSAEGKEGNIDLGETTENALKNKAAEHNDKMSSEDRPPWTRVRLGALRSVWRRGAGAFSTSHRPGMTRAQWAMARVNAFLYLSEKGKPENPKYVTDNDLLHPDHPKYSGD